MCDLFFSHSVYIIVYTTLYGIYENHKFPQILEDFKRHFVDEIGF